LESSGKIRNFLVKLRYLFSRWNKKNKRQFF